MILASCIPVAIHPSTKLQVEGRNWTHRLEGEFLAVVRLDLPDAASTYQSS